MTPLPPSTHSANRLRTGLLGFKGTISRGRDSAITSYVDLKTVVTWGNEIKGELGRAESIERIVWSASPSKGRYSANELTLAWIRTNEDRRTRSRSGQSQVNK
jgi:hypothetical protein